MENSNRELKSSSKKLKYMNEYYQENKKSYRESQKIYYQKNKQRWIDSALRRFYNISLGEVSELLKAQNNSCAICNIELNLFNGIKGKDKPVVDHCHNNKNIRGLLCHSCNLGLGNFKDNINSLKRAVEYIERNNKWKLPEGLDLNPEITPIF